MTGAPHIPSENGERRVRVVVIGGGPAGSATAMALSRAGLSVNMIEGSNNERWRIGEGLPPLARPVLQKLGLWDLFLEAGHLPSYGNCSAWGSPGLIDHNFIFDPHGNGWHLDRRRFDDMLIGEAVKAGVVLQPKVNVTSSRRGHQGEWVLELTSAEGVRSRIVADFVVDATGRKSWFARRQGSRRICYDWMVGLIGLLIPEGDQTDNDSLTMVEATEEGWWYSALIPDRKLVVAYMSDGDLATTRSARRADGWMALLKETKHTRERIEAHGYNLLDGPRITSANSSRLISPAGESWLAVGDAANGYDPLSSQGIITALEMGIEAAEAIQARLQGSAREPGEYVNNLKDKFVEYLARRRFYYSQERRWPGSLFWRRRSLLPG